MVEILEQIAYKHGILAPVFIGIAQCESQLRAGAQNDYDTDGKPSRGLFQFQDKTWKAFGKGNVWDFEDNARAAARIMRAGGWHNWKNCHAETIKKLQNLYL